MPLLALSLVTIAAITHASWNLLAKRAAGAQHFVFLFGLIAVALWGPLAVVAASDATLTWLALLALLGSGVLHLVYSLVLQYAYKVGDLSVVYPVTRGTGPLVAFVGAIVILGERPSVAVI
jgi:drug/metabolite transporter (DMT)-like permease